MAKKDKDFLKRIRDRYNLMTDADEENRRDALEDIRFANVPGAQWYDNMKQERGDRPCYEFNKVRVNGKRVINEIRANRPSGKVRGVEGGDVKTAEIYEGLIRNIWNMSDGDTIIDYAAEYQVGGGMGSWRVTTEEPENSFYQDIKIEPLQNPFCLFWDPSARDQLKKDAKDCILTEKISIESFETRWPKAETVDFEDSEYDDDQDWRDEEQVRICEYWWKEPSEREIWLLQDDKVISADSTEAPKIPEEQIKERKTVKYDKIKMVICSGDAILERADWAGSYLPFIVVYGEYIVIDGRTYWFGLHRFAKDAQRSYNVSRTAITETIAQSPQAKYWATATQAKGHTAQWEEAHRKNFPFLMFNPDPKQSGVPQRMGSADVPVALIQESQLASQEIDATQGIYGDDRGEKTSAQSGRAIYAREQQGQVVTFNFPDNMAKGIKRTWEILIDLIPKVYDTERELRVLGSDGAEDYVKINSFAPDKETGEMVKINDLNMGRYDTTITIGPSFTTKRQEAAEIYMQLTQSSPEIMGIAGDLVFKSMDLPYADDIADRLKAMLPPQIQQLLNKEQDVPPEVQAMMQQAEQAMQQVQMMGQEVQQAAQEADVDKAEVEKLIANLKTEEARFEAKVAQEIAKLTKQEAGIVQKDANLTKTAVELSMDQFTNERDAALDQDKQGLAEQMAQGIEGINQMANEFVGQAVEALQTIKQEKDNKPRVIRMDAVRENGQLSAVPVYEDEIQSE